MELKVGHEKIKTQIDEALYKLYGLTEKEIRIVEKND